MSSFLIVCQQLLEWAFLLSFDFGKLNMKSIEISSHLRSAGGNGRNFPNLFSLDDLDSLQR